MNGLAPTWSSSAKDIVLTAVGPSRIWATLGHGIVNEVYFPSTGQPQIRDLGFIVARPGAWHEVKRVNDYSLSLAEPYMPLPTVLHRGDGYTLRLEVLCDPKRETLLVRYELRGEGFTLYPLLATHLGPSSGDNTAWVQDGALYAAGAPEFLCLCADTPFTKTGVGYVGVSDGWQDFARNGAMTWTRERAEHGNVALMAEAGSATGVLALGFGESAEGARTRARSSLAEGWAAVRDAYHAGWRDWGAKISLPPSDPAVDRVAHVSAAVLKVHRDKSYPGATVASLSIPWGNSRDDLGGYHLVWPRDAVEAGFGLLAAGLVADAAEMLAYLVATQRPDGRWPQNMFPDGTPYWTGIQLDEVGFPVILAAKLDELGRLGDSREVAAMVRSAASYLARFGPVSPQDRWEENAGSSPFTLAVEVAALVAAARWLEGDDAAFALSLADYWNERIEDWTYAERTDLCSAAGVPGYYVRIAPPPADGGLRGRVDVRNRDSDPVLATELVSLDFLYLSRLGLRAALDPRMVSSLTVAERCLRVDTPCGVSYHRYNGDGYGEHEGGGPYDGTGVGRAWPLLTGERGHYALQAGEDPTPYLEAMARMTGPGGLIPEQVWDAEAVPEKGLFPGKPTGSAMPLVWAHAEFLKLLHARDTGRPIELLDVVRRRYASKRPSAATWHWRADAPFDSLPAGRSLSIEGAEPFEITVHGDAGSPSTRRSRPTGLGMHAVRLEAQELARHAEVTFEASDMEPASISGAVALAAPRETVAAGT
ncbi:MAG TPA: glycoside hydrolase family 15 protein [Trueperaceae bacterium]